MILGFGTAAIGRPHYINIRTQSNDFNDVTSFKENGYRILDKAYDLGIKYFDTAPGYGIAEEILLNWIRDRKPVGIELATKWGYKYTADFKKEAKVHEIKDHGIELLNEQWAFSKSLLPHLKTLQIHSATFETGVLKNEQVLHRLAKLKLEHALKIGFTTTGSNQLEVFKQGIDVEVAGAPLFDMVQVTYNLLDQSMLEASQICAKRGLRFVVKEALANGRFFENTEYSHYKKLYETLNKLAKKYEVGVDAIALSFCSQTTSHDAVILSGASSIEQLNANVKCNDIDLNEDDLSVLKAFKTEPEQYWRERKKLDWN